MKWNSNYFGMEVSLTAYHFVSKIMRQFQMFHIIIALNNAKEDLKSHLNSWEFKVFDMRPEIVIIFFSSYSILIMNRSRSMCTACIHFINYYWLSKWEVDGSAHAYIILIIICTVVDQKKTFALQVDTSCEYSSWYETINKMKYLN